MIAAVFNTTSTSAAPVLDAVAEALRTSLSDGHNDDSGESQDDQCKRSHLLGKLVHNASPFLFPCAIEYSLICAAILYVIISKSHVSTNLVINVSVCHKRTCGSKSESEIQLATGVPV